MLSPHKEIKEMLEECGPVYYEQFVKQGTQTPFITYRVDSNIQIYPTTDPTNDTMRYSKIDVYVKVWGSSLTETLPLFDKADVVMIEHGFRRSSYTELPIGSNVCLIGLYKAIGLEKGE